MAYTSYTSQVKSRIADKVGQGLERIAQRIVEQAKSTAPVDTGELKDSISYKRDGMQVEVMATADHSAVVELGSSTRSPNPYLTPSIERYKDDLPKEMK